MIDNEADERILQVVAFTLVAALFWMLAMFFSLLSSPSYRLPVLLALGFQIAFFWMVWARVQKSGWLGRVLWAIPLAPLVLYFVDNIGRFLSVAGLGGFRILI